MNKPFRLAERLEIGLHKPSARPPVLGAEYQPILIEPVLPWFCFYRFLSQLMPDRLKNFPQRVPIPRKFVYRLRLPLGLAFPPLKLAVPGIATHINSAL